MVRALQIDYRTAPVSEQDRVMLDYVVQLTRNPAQVTVDDLQHLRQVGLRLRYLTTISLFLLGLGSRGAY